MTTCLTKSHQMLAVVILLWTCVSTLAVSTSASSSTTPSPTPQATPTDGCCAKCIGKTTDLPYTYDPVVHAQCSAAKGVCCYNCGQDSAAQINIVNADYGDDGVTPQVKAGEWVQVAWPNIARVTYEFYQPNQNKTTTVRNGSSEARISGGYFYICAKTKGYMYVRGWGQDPCLSATTEDKIEIIAGKDSASCGRLPNSDEDESTSGSSSSHAAANTSSEQSGSTQTVTKNDIEETCNTQRASIVVQADGTKQCVCAAEWTGPPSCGGFPWWKIAITVGGGIAAVLSIVVSVKAYLNAKKANKARATGEAILGSDSITIAGRESMGPRRPSHEGYETHRGSKETKELSL